MKYEGYEDAEGTAMIPSSHTPEQRGVVLVPPFKLIFECEAETWTEAMTKWHEFNGWEPYKPFGERDM